VAVAPIAAHANPLGGQVTAGTATMQGQGTNQVTVNQTSQNAIVNWNTFNIGSGETTHINMPNASSIELDRVTGGLGPSQVLGSLYSNGKVFLVNPDGILFGPSAVINTGSFLATTHNIADSDFMAGRFNFTIPGNPAASVVNQGTITAAKGGFAALVAPGVRNDGVITAKLGTVALASGNGFTLDPYGDNLIKLQLGDAIASQVIDVATGKPLSSLVQNTGTLKANGGQVQLTAVAARRIIDSVINSSGVIEANTVGTRAGKVIFGAATAASKPIGAPTQTVKVSGKISAAGKKQGTKGGLVQITGENIQVANATINASGKTGGGTILIGGDYHGGNPDPVLMAQYGLSLQPWTVPTATTVSVDQASTLSASAITSGNGGKVVVWSNQTTTFYGTILAKGGMLGGNGGFAEVSGASNVVFSGMKADLSAAKGTAGTILFDPTSNTIDSAEAATIDAILNNGTNDAITADQIVVAANILKTAGGDATLTFNATDSLTINNGIIIGSSSGKVNVDINLTSVAFDANGGSCNDTSCTSPSTFLYFLAVDMAQNELLTSSVLNKSYPLSQFVSNFITEPAGIVDSNNTTGLALELNTGLQFGTSSKIYTNGGTFSISGNSNSTVLLSTSGGCGSRTNCVDLGVTGDVDQPVDVLVLNSTTATSNLESSGPIPGIGPNNNLVSFNTLVNLAPFLSPNAVLSIRNDLAGQDTSTVGLLVHSAFDTLTTTLEQYLASASAEKAPRSLKLPALSAAKALGAVVTIKQIADIVNDPVLPPAVKNEFITLEVAVAAVGISVAFVTDGVAGTALPIVLYLLEVALNYAEALARVNTNLSKQ
jgi:filamentous hemagglutinin family protein